MGLTLLEDRCLVTSNLLYIYMYLLSILMYKQINPDTVLIDRDVQTVVAVWLRCASHKIKDSQSQCTGQLCKKEFCSVTKVFGLWHAYIIISLLKHFDLRISYEKNER